jgi:hypothetical protein
MLNLFNKSSLLVPSGKIVKEPIVCVELVNYLQPEAVFLEHHK